MTESPCLVDSTWLVEQLRKPNWHQTIRLLDATWDVPQSKRDFVKEHEDKRIQGAKYFSIFDCSDKTSPLPHTVPKADQFEEYVSKLGISNEHHVILYDNSVKFGLYSAPRAWWMFRIFGHKNVSVLDGGLPKWISDGNPVVSGRYSDSENLPGSEERYKAYFRPELLRELEFMKGNVTSDDPIQMMDARPSIHFIQQGHMPKSLNAPFMGCLGENKCLKSEENLKQYLSECGINLDNDIISSCGAGIASSLNLFAVYYCSGKEIPLYDGSWYEWQANTPPELQVRPEKSE